MSIEYTIDIQLTELGFPDILQPQESADRETSSEDSFSPSHSPTPLSSSNKQSVRVRGADKQTSNIGQSTVSETLLCKPLNPAQSLQDEQAVKGTVLPGLSEATADDPAAGWVTADLPLLITVQDDKKEKNVDNYSDDSEVSEAYEEEEVDEEDEDEDGPSKESGLLGDYRCSVCDLQLPSKFRLQDHMNLHTGARPYCCAECGKRFCQIYNYRVHLRTHAQTKTRHHLCRVCRMGFASQEDLKDHVSRTHFEKEFYECDLCKHVFTSLEACKYHVQSHKCLPNVVCDVCGRNFSSLKYLQHHRKWICHRIFKCTDCAKTFTKKNALLKHSFSHLGLLPYTCIRCQCHFRLARLYRQHKCEPERIHCVACLREFPSQGDFQQHKKDTGCWGNQEPKGDEIRCLECGQRFDTPDELKQHAGAHQRVLKCAECGKGFRSALLLMSHMGGHAGNSPCLCQSCGLGFPHQQNYDSHLKTCGQTPQPACAPKKRQASKSSSSRTKKASTKPDSSKPTVAAAAPADASESSAAPAKDRCSPGVVTGDASAGSGPPDGLWKLTLDKQPPPGAQLVLFLPVCPTQADDLTLPSVVSETQPGPAMQLQPDEALLPVSNEQLRLKAALGAPLNAPLDLVTGIKQDPECEAPLDLSKKSNLSKPAPLHPVKSEPEEFEISEEADSSERRAFGDSNAVVKTSPRDTYSEVRQFKLDSTDFPPLKVNSSSSGPTVDIKEEPLSLCPGPGSDSWSSTSCQLTENNMKMEVDISSPAHADIEK